MTSLADQSAIVDFPWPAWVALALLTLGILAADQIHNAPLCDPEPSTLDQRDAVTKPVANCTVPFCEARVTVHLHVGQDWWTFCLEHGTPYLTENLRGEAS